MCIIAKLASKNIWKMKNDLLFFQGFDKLIDIKTSNKSNQSTVEKYVRHWANFSSFSGKSSWMKVVHGCYSSILQPEEQNWHLVKSENYNAIVW